MSPLTQRLNYRSAWDVSHAPSLGFIGKTLSLDDRCCVMANGSVTAQRTYRSSLLTYSTPLTTTFFIANSLTWLTSFEIPVQLCTRSHNVTRPTLIFLSVCCRSANIRINSHPKGLYCMTVKILYRQLDVACRLVFVFKLTILCVVACDNL